MKLFVQQRAGFAGLSAATVVLIVATGCASNFSAPPSAPTACADLNGLGVSQQVIGLPTTGAVVTSAAVVPAAWDVGGAAIGAVVAVCWRIGCAVAPEVDRQNALVLA